MGGGGRAMMTDHDVLLILNTLLSHVGDALVVRLVVLLRELCARDQPLLHGGRLRGQELHDRLDQAAHAVVTEYDKKGEGHDEADDT